LNTGAECANCHGGVSAGYGGGAWVAGISASHADAQITPNHDVCYYCHLYKNGDVTYYNITNATQHRDGNIEIGAQNDSGTDTHIGFRDNGATVGCVNCHLANDGVGNGLHEFADVTGTTRWGTRDLLITGPVFD